jgi:Cys/Met metabolism PLP-dependent enzyme
MALGRRGGSAHGERVATLPLCSQKKSSQIFRIVPSLRRVGVWRVDFRLSMSVAAPSRAIHAGAAPDATTGARSTPIYQTTADVFDDVDHAASLSNLHNFGYIYSRL